MTNDLFFIKKYHSTILFSKNLKNRAMIIDPNEDKHNDSNIHPEWRGINLAGWLFVIICIFLLASCSAIHHTPAPAANVPLNEYEVSEIKHESKCTYAKVNGLYGWFKVSDTTKEGSLIKIGIVKR